MSADVAGERQTEAAGPDHPRTSLRGARGEFYVGYARMAPGLRSFSTVVGLVLIFATSGFAFATFFAQDTPPRAGYGPRAKLEGVFQAEPHPMIHVAPPPDAPPGQTLVLARPGKSQVNEAKAARLDGKPVQVGGIYTQRDGVKFFQVAGGGPNALRVADPATTATPPESWRAPVPEDLGTHRLKGAVVDPKCYTGQMIPGAGKAHKGCAAFCLLNRIPPYFVSRRPFGGVSYYLMVNADGSALDESVTAYVSDPVAVTGRVERLGSLLVFKTNIDSIERL
ncbi:MAG: hypothetical protein ACR2RL_20940 [Gammaproteobacteria bacterium]